MARRICDHDAAAADVEKRKRRIGGQAVTKEKLAKPRPNYRHRCERCGIVVEGEWPCLTAADAKQCKIASAAGVVPKSRINRN